MRTACFSFITSTTGRLPTGSREARDALAVYLMEHQVEKLEDEPEENTNYNEMANAVIRRFCSREVGWLEEDIDDATYEKHIMMTEQGVVLAEFDETGAGRIFQLYFQRLQHLKRPGSVGK